MRNVFSAALMTSALLGSACNDKSGTSSTSTTDSNSVSTTDGSSSTLVNNAAYVDLNTGQSIQIVLDSAAHVTNDVATGKPVQFYVNTITSDTFDTHGRLVNNALIQTDGVWTVDETKIKFDDDGMKMKTDDQKLKVEGDESKLKTDAGKLKTEGDKSKIKTDDLKIKNDNGEIKVKDK